MIWVWAKKWRKKETGQAEDKWWSENDKCRKYVTKIGTNEAIIESVLVSGRPLSRHVFRNFFIKVLGFFLEFR